MSNELAPQEILLRLVAALLVGAALGINRDLEGKPAGMRTLGLVALGAAIITIATLYLDAIQQDSNATSRVLQGIIQGVLTGIGFIGAGVVLRREKAGEVHGLTTAANVLVVSTLGVSCGLALWWIVGIGAGLALVLLAVLQPVEKSIEHRRKARKAPPESGA